MSGRIECSEEQVEEIKKYTSLPVTAWVKKYKYGLSVNPLLAGANVSLGVNSEDAVDDTDYHVILYNSNVGEVSSMPIAIGQEILIPGLKMGYDSYVSNGNAIEINGLLPGKRYDLTPYVIFTTESFSGIYDVEYVQPEVTVVGYYDIMGRRYDKPIRGINIVVYSDGTTKKLVYRGR